MKGSVETESSCKRGMKEKMKKWREGSMPNSPKSMNRPSGEQDSEPTSEPKSEPKPEPKPEPTSKPEPEPNPEPEKGGSGKDKMGVCG